MKKSRVAILLIFIAILFQSGVAIAQRSLNNLEVEEEFTRHFDLIIDVGANQTSHKFEARKDWGSMFFPPGGSMTLGEIKRFWTFGVGIGYTKILVGNSKSWQIRLPISYQVACFDLNSGALFFAKKEVFGTVVDWWDIVMVNDLVVEHFTPKVGIRVVKGNFGIGFSVQHYRLMLRDYLGEDNWGGVNTSRVVISRQIESGVSFQVDLLWGEGGFYMETMGGFKTVSFGLIGYLSWL